MRIPLHSKLGDIRAWTTIDEADLRLVETRRWHLTSRGYARAFQHIPGQRSSKSIYMHRLICGLAEGDGQTVDHINGDKLDNRRPNLRVTDQSINCRNRGHMEGFGASRVRGVYFSARDRRWRGQIKLRGKVLSLGGYATEAEAEAAVRAWRLENDPQPRWLASLEDHRDDTSEQLTSRSDAP